MRRALRRAERLLDLRQDRRVERSHHGTEGLAMRRLRLRQVVLQRWQQRQRRQRVDCRLAQSARKLRVLARHRQRHRAALPPPTVAAASARASARLRVRARCQGVELGED